jgi:hypothetical protein
MTVQTDQESLSFQAEVTHIRDLMAQSLYTRLSRLCSGGGPVLQFGFVT